MSTLFNFLIVFTFSISAYAFDLDRDYTSLAKQELQKIESCKETFEGCTTEQELAIAEIHGNILSSRELSELLYQDKDNSYFIPLELNNKELLLLAAATSLGVVAFHHDQEITDIVSKHSTQITETATRVGNFLGGTAFIPISAGSYFLGVFYKDNKLKQVGLFTVGASVAAGIVVSAVKSAFGRIRPHERLGPYEFFNSGHQSFYSGHTSQAFTLATVISEMYKDDYPIVPWIAYGLASVTAYARVHGQDHWASDVIVGAIAGHLVTKLFLSFKNGNVDGRGGLEIAPGYDMKTGAVTISLNYTAKEKERIMKCVQIENLEKRIEACFEEAFGDQ